MATKATIINMVCPPSAVHTHTQQAGYQAPPGLYLSDPVGIGLRSAHYEDIIEQKPPFGFLEIHPENYFCGGINRHYLDKIAEHYPISLHGVGLSLGSDQSPDNEHLKKFKALIDRYDPILISDHVAWSASGNAHLNDLLPLPYTQESLTRVSDNIKKVQDFFGRNILVENPSTYIAFKDNDMSEQDFMNRLAETANCAILLDINNIYVQSHNHGLDARAYIAEIDPRFVREMHLAGHIERQTEKSSLLIDTHNQNVCDGVWELFSFASGRFKNIPTLIEWDTDLPALSVLESEARKAQKIIKRCEANEK